MTITLGDDVSVWQQGEPPFNGTHFLIARATIGTEVDPTYAGHIAAARAAGQVVGAFHFNWKEIPVAAQVAAFLAAAGDVDLYALDCEGLHEFSLVQMQAFIAGVQAAGKRIGMYHSLSGFPDAGQDWNWVAFYSPTPPPIHWDIWQYGADHNNLVTGNPIDGDEFHGSLAQLLAFAGKDDMDLSLIKGEDWTVAGGVARPVRATPDRTVTGKIVGYIGPGVTVRTIAEASTPDGNVWRLTAFNGAPGWLLRSDFSPLVQGGDPAVAAVLAAFISRAPDAAIAPLKSQVATLQAEVAAAKADITSAQAALAAAQTALG